MRGVPERGEIWHLDLDPTRGHEQQGKRFVLVVSPNAFNRLGLAWACPITQGGQHERMAGFAVTLMGAGTQTQGVVQTSQLRALDWRARGAKHVERVPTDLIDEVLARIAPLVS
jgi:mRNA-degrading endonuclease toxin of MazEF toxin-antitoxin module